MVKNNKYTIPKENLVKVEIIQEINNNEIPTYEEFMQTYEQDKKAVDSYENEFDSYGDVQVKRTYYGPGFWDDIKVVVKPVASAALVAASVFPPTAAVAVPVTLCVAGTGAAAVGIGHVTDNDGWKEVGKDILEIADHAMTGQDATDKSGISTHFQSKSK